MSDVISTSCSPTTRRWSATASGRWSTASRTCASSREAADGVEAIALTRRHRPDVVLMDIRMPNIDGLTATARVLALPEPPRVLVLTTFDRNEWVYEALRAGASGFLLKDVRGGQLTDAIRTVAAGEALLAPVDHPPADRAVRRPAAGRAAPRRRRPRSPNGRRRCCGCSPPGCPTPRSPTAWSSATRR